MARYGRSRVAAVSSLSDVAAAAGRRDTQMGALARALVTVERHGVAVPDTWVVVAETFRHVAHDLLPPGHEPGSLLRTIQRPVGVERASRARERLLEVALDTELERELDGVFGAAREGSPWGVAVRVSAVVPDQGMARTAGLSRTELPLMDREAFGAAVRRAWATSVSESTLGYLRARRVRDVALALVVQPVVVADATIVLVTDARSLLGPSAHDGAHRARRLAVGLSGLATEAADLALAEVVTFDTEGHVVARRPGSQQRRTVVRGGRLVEEAAPAGTILTDARVAELAEIARRLESVGGAVVRCVLPPRGDAVVVDMHPLQHLGHLGAGSAQTLWARAAAAEAPAAPLTPLSRHLITRPLLDRAREAFGDQAPRAARLAAALTTLAGRPYLDLSAFFEADGGREPADPVARVELSGAQWTHELEREPSWRPSLARAGLRVAQIASEQRALSADVSRFERDAEQRRRWLAELDLAILPDDALTTTLHEVSDFLARGYALHARAAALSLSGHTLLGSVLAGADATRASWLAHAVVAGADVATTRPAAAFCHLASIARLDPAAEATMTPGEATAPPAAGPFRRALSDYLSAYGDRGFAEPELSSPRWGEDPAPLLALLAAALRGPDADPQVALSRARSLADRELALLEPRLSYFETRFVRDIVSRQRELLRLRERCRVRLSHGFAMMRVVALDVDRRLRRLDPTLAPGSTLFLTFDEVLTALSKYRADLAPIARARRADFEAQLRSPEPPAVFRGAPEVVLPARVEGPWRGLRVSAGTAEGRVVRVGRDLAGLARFTPGDVLVLPSLDLGFAPLFLHARAVVAELGTPFSSSAVVARDCCVPVVTGIPGLSALLSDGQRVHVAGDEGTVELLPA